MTDLIVNVNKTIHAPILKVFNAWLDPKTLSQFILPMPGMPKPEVETDPREQGQFTILMHVGDDKIPHTGKYIKISPPDKLIFSWESPFSTANSTVTLNFTKIDENTTHIDLTHVKFPDEESRSNHEGGWKNILTELNNIIK